MFQIGAGSDQLANFRSEVAPLTSRQQEKYDLGLCIRPWCRHKRDRANRRRICTMHNQKEWRTRHPLRYMFHNMRTRAHVRRIEFSLTLEDFLNFAAKLPSLGLRQNLATDMTVDRRDPTKGYEPDNLMWSTRAFNTARHNTYLRNVRNGQSTRPDPF